MKLLGGRKLNFPELKLIYVGIAQLMINPIIQFSEPDNTQQMVALSSLCGIMRGMMAGNRGIMRGMMAGNGVSEFSS